MLIFMLLVIIVTVFLLLSCLIFWLILHFRKIHSSTATKNASASPSYTKKQVALILNPVKCDKISIFPEVEALCLKDGLPNPLYYETTIEDPGYGVASEAISCGAEIVIVAGGDGTVRSVASRLINTEVALSILPVGTGNLLARNLNIYPNKLLDALYYAFSGEEHLIDVGKIFLKNHDKQFLDFHEDIFLVMSGFGFDADVITKTKPKLKRAIGWFAYIDAGMRNLPGKKSKVSINIDDHPVWQHKVRTIIVGNCSILPTGINLFPDALLDDGELDVMIVSPRNIFAWISVFGEVLFKFSKRRSNVDYHKARKIIITSADVLNVQADGDSIGSTKKLRLEILPESLKVRVPSSKKLEKR